MLLKGTTINVHDHGYVRYLDHMGTDSDIVESARVSYKGGSKGYEQDMKLLGYLFSHKHTSPFEMVKIKFNIKMPIFVCRQYVRHRMQNMNEVSARYGVLPSDFYLPDFFRAQDTKNKQGSVPSEEIDQVAARDETMTAYRFCYRTYESLLKKGVAREQARIVLPVGIYTEFYCCWDLNNLLKYFLLRDDAHAQGEHQDYATAMKQITEHLFPETMKLYAGLLNRTNTIASMLRSAMEKKVEEAPDTVKAEDVMLTVEEIVAILSA